MKGNEAIAHAAIRFGFDGYFGYPITPQSEVLETLEELMPWETTGMVVLQAESEVAAINMVYGGAAAGKAVLVAVTFTFCPAITQLFTVTVMPAACTASILLPPICSTAARISASTKPNLHFFLLFILVSLYFFLRYVTNIFPFCRNRFVASFIPTLYTVPVCGSITTMFISLKPITSIALSFSSSARTGMS